MATTYYIDPTGSDSTGIGTITSPWRSLYRACASAKISGDIIHLNAGTYEEYRRCEVSAGVSIEGAGLSSIIKSDFSTGYLIYGNSTTLVDEGHTISNLTFDGSSLDGWGAIRFNHRNNIVIHDCSFYDFKYAGIMIDNENTWELPPATYATGCKIYNCTITNCDTSGGYASVYMTGVEGLEFYNNKLSQTTRGFDLTGQNILNFNFYKGCKFYNNLFYSPSERGTAWNFAAEQWNSRGGNEYYNNKFYGGGTLDIGGHNTLKEEYDYSVKIYDNEFILDYPPLLQYHPISAISLENWVSLKDVYVYNNYIKNFYWGINMTMGIADGSATNINIYNNIFDGVGCSGTGWGIAILAQVQSQRIKGYYDINLYNNTIYGELATSYKGILFQCSSTTKDVNIKNNIVTGFTNYPISFAKSDLNEIPRVENVAVTNNILYDNYDAARNFIYYEASLSLVNCTSSNIIKSDPLFYNGSNHNFYLKLGSPAIDAGINVGLITDYDGNLWEDPPSIGAYEYINTPVYRTTYYVSSTDGSDSYNGLSPFTPWKTLAKVNASLGALSSSDGILFKRGDTFDGSIVINKSGASNAYPFVFGAYDSGEKPIISSFTDISGTWKDYSTNIWSRSVTANSIKYLTINSSNYFKGQSSWRIPNSGGTTYLVDSVNLTQANDYWIGAESIVRLNAYWIYTKTITDSSQSGTSITWSPANPYNINTNYKYKLQNHIDFLTQNGDWCYKDGSVFIYYNTNPSSLTIKVGTQSDGITINGGYVTIDNLNITGYYNNAINCSRTLQTSTSCNIIQNCNISYCTQAIYFAYTNSYIIRDNSISYIGNNGIVISYSHDGSIVRNKMDYIATRVGWADQALTAIRATYSNGTEVFYNDINHVGYIGINLSVAKDCIVQYNRVRDYCRLLWDGGGIYSYYNDASNVSGYTNTIWRNNFVEWGGYTSELTASSSTNNEYYHMGLYMDGGSTDFTIENNLAVGNRWNIMSNNTSNTIIRNNWTTKCYDSSWWFGSEIELSNSGSLVDLGIVLHDISILNNKFITNWKEEYVKLNYAFHSDEITGNFYCDYNYYSLATGNQASYTDNPIRYNDTMYNVSTWIAGPGGANETSGNFVYSPSYQFTSKDEFVSYDFNFSDTSRNYDMSTGWTYYDISGNVQTSYTLSPYTGAILFRINNSDFPVIDSSGPYTYLRSLDNKIYTYQGKYLTFFY